MNRKDSITVGGITVRPAKPNQSDPQWYDGTDGDRDATTWTTRSNAHRAIASKLHWSRTGLFFQDIGL